MTSARAELFDGLPGEVVDDVLGRAERRRVAAGDDLCREGEPGDTLLIVDHGVAEVLVGPAEDRVRRLRRGDVVGEVAFITGEPRSATVRAVVDTDVLVLHRDVLSELLALHPELLANITRILGRRLARAHVEHVARGRGEAVAVLLGRSVADRSGELLVAATAATPRRTVGVGPDADVDQLLAAHDFVFVVAGADTPALATTVAQLDRVVAVGTAAEVAELADRVGGAAVVEPVVVDGELRVAWLGRHLTRTKLGLALGAGGAKGYAHVGALAVLEQAGYTIDAVAGSSIGAVVAACIAMGMDSEEIERTLRKRFSPETVKEVFSLSFAGTSTGYEAMRELTVALVGDRTFADLEIPMVAMSVDLVSRLPVPLGEGPVADALLAATALAGLFPPFESDGRRLVDGLALDPVPVSSVAGLGADVLVSVNLMSRDVLPAWPGEEPPPPPTGRQRMLETLLDVMDLTQTDLSVRSAAVADVVLTPTFGPCTWRDFHLADRFSAAGRDAAVAALGHLRSLATPTHARP